MTDIIGQEIEYGDLVIYVIGKEIKVGRVVEKAIDSVKLCICSNKFDPEGERLDTYRITSRINICYIVVLEREFIQPELKDKLEQWNKLKKKPELGKYLGMDDLTMAMWSKNRCSSLEK
jgi:hypothetical protein